MATLRSLPLDMTLRGPVQRRIPRAQALCLTGGGYRGLYSVRILEHMRSMTQAPLHEYFRFIAGTSIGAIIGAALAAGIEPKRIREEIESAGPKLFSGSKLNNLKRWWTAPYSQTSLSDTLTKLFKEVGKEGLLDKPITKSGLALIVTAVSLSASEPRIFGGKNIPFQKYSKITLREALLASSAAPTYFPAKLAADETLVDGGLIANAPDIVALGLLQRRFGAALPNCHILSIGTCPPAHKPLPAQKKDSGIAGWARQVVDLTLDSQQKLTIQIMDQLLGERFLRIDTVPTGSHAKAIASLDVANRDATLALKTFADLEWIKRAKDRRLHAFFVKAIQV
jgi:patatin-like phospholipase/acyl hydrolase